MLEGDFHKDLLDSHNFSENFDVKGINKETALKILRKLEIIREAEFKLALEKKNKSIRGPVHLSAGQEAIPVGISEHLRKSDYIFGAHRSHGHILALGSSLRKLFVK